MKHFKKPDNSLHAFDDQYEGDLITEDMTPINDEELAALLEPALATLKAEKNNEINAARMTANFTSFTHGGKLIACDALSRSDIDGTNGYVALNGALPAGWPGGWKAIDNTYLVIADVAAWKAFYASMFATGNANFAHAQQLKATLAAATTAEQVAAIVW
ncbi:MAG: DUF4376 domain-containing protein [Acidovorax sp.]|nr:DUF4376 domain-containing protein [Acidovorax sp.]